MNPLHLLAHAVPSAPDAGLHVPLWASLLLALGAGLIPLMAGWALGCRARSPLGIGMAGGFLLYLFVDFLSLTANLGASLQAPVVQAGMLAAFLAGLLLPAYLEAAGRPPALLWAAGVGLHSLGEGIIMGYNMHLGWGVVLAPLAMLSFMGHKAAEGFTLGLLPGARPVAIGAAAALPVVLGAGLGYFGVPGLVSNFAYATGAGATAWCLTLFLKPAENRWRLAVGLAAGYTLIYLVGLLHAF